MAQGWLYDGATEIAHYESATPEEVETAIRSNVDFVWLYLPNGTKVLATFNRSKE